LSASRAADAALHLDLIYLLAGTAERRASNAGAARARLQRVDFDVLAAELEARRLLPLIGHRILDLEPSVPDSFRYAVMLAWARTAAQADATVTIAREVASTLAAEGIPAVVLKGPWLARAAHGDAGLRENSDIDLLVPRARLDDAARLLVASGYEPPTDAIRANGLPDLHLVLRRPASPSVELHWRIHWYEDELSAALLERARPGLDDVLELASDDVAIALLLFYARDGFHGVRIAADIAAWSDRNSVQPGELRLYLERYPRLAPALTAAAIAADELTGSSACAWLGVGKRPRGRRVALATRLADWSGAGERDQLAANISLADGLLAPLPALPGFARRQLGRSKEGGPLHVPKMLGRYARALWQVRSGRRWVDPPQRSYRERQPLRKTRN
jgi:hypothetical protein